MTETADTLVRELPKAILAWYPFDKGSRALLLSYKEETLNIYKEMLETDGLTVDAYRLRDYETTLPIEHIKVTDTSDDQTKEGSDNDSEEIETYAENIDYKDEPTIKVGSGYKYVVMLGAFEYMKRPQVTLESLKNRLSEDGTMLIAMDNRFGLRYFCGDRDIFTDRNFDGIEDYIRINQSDRSSMHGRGYTKAEAFKLLTAAGLQDTHSFSVLPSIDEPQLFYAEDYTPQEEMSVRFNEYYNNPDTIFIQESSIYQKIIENGMFHQMANGYLIECGRNESSNQAYDKMQQVTVSMERGREYSLATIIRRDNTVVKKALYAEGVERLKRIIDNDEYLRARGVKVVDSKLVGDEYIMPYVEGESAVTYFKRLFSTDLKLLYRELRRFFDVILSSSDAVDYDEIDWYHYAPGNEKQKSDDPNYDKWYNIAHSAPNALGKILKRGFIDMVSLNCFVVDGEFVFYDQEFTVENLPAYTILWRTIHMIYMNNLAAAQILDMNKLCDMMGLGEYADFYASFSHDFIGKLRNWKELRIYHSEHVADYNVINANRQRMNYTQEDYQRLFVDIFKGIENRKLYLFGSGNFARRFISQFGKEVKIEGLLDNNKAVWDTEVLGYEIKSPDILTGMDPNEYKVIICIKNYVPVLKQLQAAGARHISFYDWSLQYEHKLTAIEESVEKKPYHVGYIAGVFDLFHVGHLNLLRRAKQQCDYLIVGVVSDLGVISKKKTTPYIPFSERIDIVRSCKYVDEAVEIPYEVNDSDEAFRRYQFDVQFSGSDYADDPDWLAKQAYLRKHGADLVFFPYTQSTSSTKLKAVISENTPKKGNKEAVAGSEDVSRIDEALQCNEDNTIDITLDDGGSGLKIACMTNPAVDPHRPNQGLTLFKETAFDGVVLDLKDYCSGQDIKQLGKKVVSIDVQRYEKVTDNPKLLWKYGFEEVRLAKEKNIDIPVIVAPHKDRDTRREDLDEFLKEIAIESMQLCKDAGTRNVLIYPCSYDQADIEKVTKWYDSLVPTAKECGVKILVSNQCKNIYGHLVRGIFSDMAQFAQWIDTQNDKHGEGTFAICLDIGTTNICGQELQENIKALGNRIEMVLVRENNGVDDSSLLPYTCANKDMSTMDYMGLIRGLREIDFEGILILDMHDTVGAIPTKIRDGMVKLGKEFMDFLAWQIGMEKGLKKYSNRVLFGAGNMCRAYMKCYGEEYPPMFTCDNNAKIWGTEFCGLTVHSPEELTNLPEDCVIYICNMFYNEIKKQLVDMGVTNPIEFFNDEYLPSYHFNRI